MKILMFATILCVLSTLAFGQDLPNIYGLNKDLNRKVYERVLAKEKMNPKNSKMGDFPIFIHDMATKERYFNEQYSICRVTTLSSPDYYLIVIIENNKYTFIDLDEDDNFNAIKKIVESLKKNNISKEKMLFYLSNVIELIEYKNEDLIRM